MTETGSILKIEGDIFAVLRNDINMILKHTLHNMIQKKGEKAELKVSLKITLSDEGVLVPKFEHKVSSVLQYKTEQDGFFGGHNYKLIWDKELLEYVLQPIQDSLFDGEEE
jgi:hypothetical protein